jgi:murein DD-endopeptidase MepM/ murein hydrolase activator NlpD
MKLIKPIKNFSMERYPKGTMTQGFGENPILYSKFDMDGHNGQDHVGPHGTPMMAVEDGTILDVKNDPSGFGMHVRFLSMTSYNGLHREWTYGHCSAIFVKVGDKVQAGQVIANMGNTGFVVSGSTPYWKNNPYAGTHLHLGLRLMKLVKNGWKYPGSDIGIDCQNYNNGFKGSIDPAPLLIGTTDPVPVAKPTVAQLTLTVISLQNTLIGLLKNKLQALLSKK